MDNISQASVDNSLTINQCGVRPCDLRHEFCDRNLTIGVDKIGQCRSCVMWESNFDHSGLKSSAEQQQQQELFTIYCKAYLDYKRIKHQTVYKAAPSSRKPPSQNRRMLILSSASEEHQLSMTEKNSLKRRQQYIFNAAAQDTPRYKASFNGNSQSNAASMQVWDASEKEFLLFLTKINLVVSALLLALAVFMMGSRLKIMRTRKPRHVQLVSPADPLASAAAPDFTSISLKKPKHSAKATWSPASSIKNKRAQRKMGWTLGFSGRGAGKKCNTAPETSAEAFSLQSVQVHRSKEPTAVHVVPYSTSLNAALSCSTSAAVPLMTTASSMYKGSSISSIQTPLLAATSTSVAGRKHRRSIYPPSFNVSRTITPAPKSSTASYDFLPASTGSDALHDLSMKNSHPFLSNTPCSSVFEHGSSLKLTLCAPHPSPATVPNGSSNSSFGDTLDEDDSVLSDSCNDQHIG